jgi:hypothetical protein
MFSNKGHCRTELKNLIFLINKLSQIPAKCLLLKIIPMLKFPLVKTAAARSLGNIGWITP